MKRMKLKNIIIGTAAAFISLPLAIIYTAWAINSQPEPGRQPEQVSLPKVTVTPVNASTHQVTINGYGEVRATDEIDLISKVEGHVIWRNPRFVSGGVVDQGDELIRIDPTEYQARLASAEHVLAEARVVLLEEERKNHQAEDEWALSGIDGKPSALVLRKPQLTAAQAAVHSAKAAVADARYQLNSTRISAPVNAVIVERKVSIGTLLSKGSSVSTMRSSDQAEISLPLSKEQWRQLPDNPEGTEVTIRGNNADDAAWKGNVARLSRTINNKTRQRTLVVTIDQPLAQPEPLLSGRFVRAELPGLPVKDVFKLPISALTVDGFIWYEQEGKLQRLRHTPLFMNDDSLFIVRDTLPETLRVVRFPLTSYREGMKVIAVVQQEGEP